MNDNTNNKKLELKVSKELAEDVLENFTLAAIDAACLCNEFKKGEETFKKEGNAEGAKQCRKLREHFFSLYETLMHGARAAHHDLNR